MSHQMLPQKSNSIILLRAIRTLLSDIELQEIASDLGINYEDLAGENKSTKARELIAFMKRHNRLAELDNLVREKLSGRDSKDIQITANTTSSTEISNLNIELASLRQQLVELQKESLTGKQVEARVQEILKTANRAVGQSEELKANLLLPPSNLTDVPLVPIHLLERLEEYRSDENTAFLLTGAFMGSILGILSNWVTNENFTITRFSIVLMILMAILTAACIFWIRNIRQRAKFVKKHMFSYNTLA